VSPGVNHPYKIRPENSIQYSDGITSTSYEVKFKPEYLGIPIKSILSGIEQVFNEIINDCRGTLSNQDLGNVTISTLELDNPIVIPLQPLKTLNGLTIMNKVSRVLNSNQSLALDKSFKVDVNLVQLVKGKGKNNMYNDQDKKKKKSLVIINNSDNSCLQRAITVGWCRSIEISTSDFKNLIYNERRNKKNCERIEIVKKYRKTSKSFNNDVSRSFASKRIETKRSKTLHNGSSGGKKTKLIPHPLQKKMTQFVCDLAGVSFDEAASLKDLPKFENALKILHRTLGSLSIPN